MYLLSSSQAVTLLFHGLFHGSSCFHPQTFCRSLMQLNCAEARHRRPVNSCSNNTSALTFSPCVSLTFLLNVGTEFTEYQCQNVFEVCVFVVCALLICLWFCVCGCVFVVVCCGCVLDVVCLWLCVCGCVFDVVCL